MTFLQSDYRSETIVALTCTRKGANPSLRAERALRALRGARPPQSGGRFVSVQYTGNG